MFCNKGQEVQPGVMPAHYDKREYRCCMLADSRYLDTSVIQSLQSKKLPALSFLIFCFKGYLARGNLNQNLVLCLYGLTS